MADEKREPKAGTQDTVALEVKQGRTVKQRCWRRRRTEDCGDQKPSEESAKKELSNA